MKVNSKRNGSHHLPCLSGLSQTPLISSGENGANNDRSTPISAHSLTLQHHQSPSRVSFDQQRRHQQQRPTTACGTPQLPAFASASNNSAASQNSRVFFPISAPRSASKSHTALDFASSFSNNLPASPSMDLNKNLENEKNREKEQDNNYHLYHEPMDPDQRSSPPPLTPRLCGPISNMNSPHDWIPPSPRPPSVADERSPILIHQQQDSINNKHAASNQPPATFSSRASSSKNDIAGDDVYFRYVHLKSTERANHRSRSYHGPKNAGEGVQIRDDQSLLNPDSANNRNLSSASVSELQASPQNAILTPRSPPLVPFRDHCVRELIETEANYVHALEMIITRFAKPLEIFLKRDENQLIFGHIRNFHHTHSLFQQDLVRATFRLFNRELPPLPSPRNSNKSIPTTPTIAGENSFTQSASSLSSPTLLNNTLRDSTSSNARAPKISTCFLNVKEKFLEYGEYCASLSKAQALLDELTSKNEVIATQLDRCQQEANEGKFKLRDLLSLPMQRILKYHLLLAQLIKNTGSSNDDYSGLRRAHEAMVDLGQYINEVKRDTEALQIMNEIEQSIVGLHLPPSTKLIDYGRLITDGFVRIRTPEDAKMKSNNELRKIKLATHDTKMKPKRYVFVFDKVMLVCKLSGSRRYEYKEALVLNEFQLEVNPVISTDTLSKHSTKDKWSFVFNLTKARDGLVYSFFAKTQEMKNKWVSAIQRAMDNTRPEACRASLNGNNNGCNNAGKHEFLMHTFDKASSCDHCGRLLLGLYYQGYRCRACFTSVHKKCLSLVRPCGPALPPKSTSATLPSVASHCSENGHFTNNLLQLSEQPWFSDRMDRDQAQALLEESPHETFLVRVSPKYHNSYVISLKYHNKVMHMRVYVAKDNQLYLSQNRYFNSLVELVSWYEKNSLIESFNMLDACLAHPYRNKC